VMSGECVMVNDPCCSKALFFAFGHGTLTHTGCCGPSWNPHRWLPQSSQLGRKPRISNVAFEV
jgi:hypothetical protein